MSYPRSQPFGVHDPEFSTPVGKEIGVEGKPSPLAIFSLVMGVIGFVVPIVAPLLAIVTGKVAVREIERSNGRIGGRSYAQAGLYLGWSWMAINVVSLLIFGFFFARLSRRSESAIVAISSSDIASPSWDFRTRPGVKLANELTPSYADWLRDSGIVSPEEPLVVAYEAAGDVTTGAEMAVVTTKRVVYVKQSNLISLPLTQIEEIVAGPEFYERLDTEGGSPASDDYSVGVIGRDGQVIRIRMPAEREGTLFTSRLKAAWKAAEGEPKAVGKSADSEPAKM
jgi:Domain of unknown function (DUF4190)